MVKLMIMVAMAIFALTITSLLSSGAATNAVANTSIGGVPGISTLVSNITTEINNAPA